MKIAESSFKTKEKMFHNTVFWSSFYNPNPQYSLICKFMSSFDRLNIVKQKPWYREGNLLLDPGQPKVFTGIEKLPFCLVSSKMTSWETKSIVFDQSEEDSNSNLDLMKSILANEGSWAWSRLSSGCSNSWKGSSSKLTLTRSMFILRTVQTSFFSGG